MLSLESRYPKTGNCLEKTDQKGINMVDLMMWLVIAAILLAAAIQGIGYYQKAAYLYQMKSDLNGAGANITALAPENNGTIDRAVADKGTADSKWSDNTSYTVEVPAGRTVPYIRATNPGVTDVDAIYLFDTCGSDYPIGVNIVPKGGNPVLEACGVTATPTSAPAPVTIDTSGSTDLIAFGSPVKNAPNPLDSVIVQGNIFNQGLTTFGLFRYPDDAGKLLPLDGSPQVSTWTSNTPSDLHGTVWDGTTDVPVTMHSTSVKLTAESSAPAMSIEYLHNTFTYDADGAPADPANFSLTTWNCDNPGGVVPTFTNPNGSWTFTVPCLQ